jgi:gamma-tubulin complex component 5
MDNRHKSWSDRFLLSELARSVFGGQSAVNASKISVRTAQVKDTARSVKPLSSVIIEVNVSAGA